MRSAECGMRNGSGRSLASPSWATPPRSPFPSHSALRIPHSALSQHPIPQGAQEHHDADDAVGGEERGIEARQISRPHQPVLPSDERGAEGHPRVVHRAQPGAEAEGNQRQHGDAVQHSGEHDAPTLPEPHHRRLEPLGPVELLVLKCVEYVEPPYPARDGRRQHPQRPSRLAPPPRHGQVARGAGDGVAEPEPEVRPPGEPLGVAVQGDHREGERREGEAERVQRPRRPYEQGGREQHGGPRLGEGEPAGGQLARPGARIAGVERAVGDAVEAHRGEPRGREREDDEGEGPPGHRRTPRGGDHAEQRERQREHGVREPDEIDVTDEQRLARQGLALAAGGAWCVVRGAHSSIPRSRHIASTRAFVPSSITIRFGHSRVKPSSFHLRVASIPIFEPNVNPRLEWSSTSIGPMVNRTSRSGSMWFSATHHASRGSCTFTSLSNTMITLASDIRPCPHRPFITLYAWPGYCLSMLTNTRLWKIPAAGMWISTISGMVSFRSGRKIRSVACPRQ